MVPQGRIELPTSSLPMMRSTTELLRRYWVFNSKIYHGVTMVSKIVIFDQVNLKSNNFNYMIAHNKGKHQNKYFLTIYLALRGGPINSDHVLR